VKELPEAQDARITFVAFTSERRKRSRTNNPVEGLIKENRQPMKDA
jgi:hypothetical protein